MKDMPVIIKNRFLTWLLALTAMVVITGFNERFYFIKIGFVCILCLVSFFISIFSDGFRINKYLPALLVYFIFYAVLRYLFNNDFDIEITVLRAILPIVYGLCVYLTAKHIDIPLLRKLFLFYYLVSMFFAIGQFFGIEYFWIPAETILNNDFITKYIRTSNMPVGLSSSPAFFGSQMAILTPFVLASGQLKVKFVKYLVLLAAFITRQRVYFATAIHYLFLRRIRKKIIVSLIIVPLLVLLILSVPSSQYYLRKSFFRGYDFDRIALFYYGIKAAIMNPFGVNSIDAYYNFVESANVYPVFEKYRNYAASTTPHNIFINTALSYGIPTLVVLVFFLSRLLKRNSEFKLSILYGLFVSLFHNLNLFFGDFFIWTFIALHLRYGRLKAYDLPQVSDVEEEAKG